MFFGGLLANQVDLVLQDDNVLQFHDFDGGQVLRRLRLGTRLVTGNQEEGSVHDRCAVQHGGHENIVTWAIDERDMTQQVHLACAARHGTGGVWLLVRGIAVVALWARAVLILTPVDLGVRVTQLDRNIPHKLVLETHSLYTRDGFDDSRLAVCDVSNRTDIDGRLVLNDLRA